MEHILDRMEGHAEGWRQFFFDELQSGKYEKYEDSPSYAGCKALNDAMNILRKHEGMKRVSMKSFLFFGGAHDRTPRTTYSNRNGG